VQELKGHSEYVNSVAFSYNSALVASASWDRTVRLWRSDTGECVEETNMGTYVTRLSFEADDSRLLTSHVPITVPKLPLAGQATANQVSRAQVVVDARKGDHCFGYGFSPDCCWVTWNGRNLLWLPAEFRPGRSAISGGTVVIGCSSGRVIFIRFDTEAVNSCFQF
jgi:WD40 repeat protein